MQLNAMNVFEFQSLMRGILRAEYIFFMRKFGKNKDENLLTRKEAAAKLKINTSTLWRWEQSGLLEPRRMGRRLYYTAEDLKEALLQIKETNYEKINGMAFPVSV